VTAAARLLAVAAWDVPHLRSAVETLAEMSERLVTWRARLDGLGRELGAGGCWTGPAADRAAASVTELSVVTWVVDSALSRSLDAHRRLAVEATAAQELAEVAVAAGAASVGLDPALAGYERRATAMNALVPGAGPPSVGTGLAAAVGALEHADAARAAARDTGAGLSAIGVEDAFAPADLGGLPAHVPTGGPAVPPDVPEGLRPEDVAAWWAALPVSAQWAAIRTSPAAVGALDGVPAWARDSANRLLLRRALGNSGLPEREAATARVVAARIAAEEATGGQVQLHLLDLTGDRVALALGDLDTAEAVALLVPGIFNTPGDDLNGLTADAEDVGVATRAAAPGAAVATMVWLGYRTPSHWGQAVVRTSAERGGPALATALDGLAAARHALAAAAPRTTVVAHSYGTWVVDEAADEPGALAADAVVLLGSPGMEDDAASLEAPAVFDAATLADPISWAGWFGERHTWEDGYGSTALPTEASMGHSDYFDTDVPTLAAMGQVVAGTRRAE
jgi:hypothetical protein